MGKLILGLVIGLVVGAAGGLFLGGGALMGTGVATGLSAGMCSTIKASVDGGLLTAEQADDVMTAAGELIAGLPAGEAEGIVGGAAECDEILRQLREAAQ